MNMNPDQEPTHEPDAIPGTSEDHVEPNHDAAPAESEGQASNKVILAVLAIIIIVLALMYAWGSKVAVVAEPITQGELVPPRVEPDYPSVEDIPADDIDTLQQELDLSELDALDRELDSLENAFDAALDTGVQ